jgi:hypothetical protein
MKRFLQALFAGLTASGTLLALLVVSVKLYAVHLKHQLPSGTGFVSGGITPVLLAAVFAVLALFALSFTLRWRKAK